MAKKRPLLAKQVWAIRARLELSVNLRDLALFNLAVDSKLRGCDLVRLKVSFISTISVLSEKVEYHIVRNYVVITAANCPVGARQDALADIPSKREQLSKHSGASHVSLGWNFHISEDCRKYVDIAGQ